jgi:hypothetical protein
MSDHFGMGAGLTGAARIYFQAARRSGRTAALVDSLKSGDRVVFTTQREARRVKDLCRDRGVDIDTFVCSPAQAQSLFFRPSPTGDARTLFDHQWVQEYYQNALDNAQREVARLQTELSGTGQAHEETRQAAQEIAKWRI